MDCIRILQNVFTHSLPKLAALNVHSFSSSILSLFSYKWNICICSLDYKEANFDFVVQTISWCFTDNTEE